MDAPFLAVGEVAPDVQAPGVSVIVDQIVRLYESPVGTAALALSFPPSGTPVSDQAAEQLERQLAPQSHTRARAELEVFSETYAGRTVEEFYFFLTYEWEYLRRVQPAGPSQWASDDRRR